jgi:hypothetical protein
MHRWLDLRIGISKYEIQSRGFRVEDEGVGAKDRDKNRGRKKSFCKA